MSALKVLVLLPLWLLLAGFANQASPSPATSASASPSPSASSSPSPSGPPPFVNLDVTAGGSNTTITVSGGFFNPGEPISLDWDKDSQHVLGSTTANAQGAFGGVKVKPFQGAPPGVHSICATVPPQPCATFTLQGPPTPTPSVAASPSEQPSPSPSGSPSPTESPIPIPAATNTNGIDALLQPPFIFLPFIAAIALIAAIAYWFFGARGRDQALPSAAITHRSSRPGYGLSDMDIRPAPLGPTPGGAPSPAEPPPTEGTDETPPISES